MTQVTDLQEPQRDDNSPQADSLLRRLKSLGQQYSSRNQFIPS